MIAVVTEYRFALMIDEDRHKKSWELEIKKAQDKIGGGAFLVPARTPN
jgi:hypothetical protein